MASDRLYDLAMQYKKTKLWKKLSDSMLIGVRLPDGSIGYCSIMGMMGEHIAIAVYCGTDGFATYRMMYEGGTDSSSVTDMIWRALSQKCLQCAFEAKDELSPKELEEARDYGRRKSSVKHILGKGVFSPDVEERLKKLLK